MSDSKPDYTFEEHEHPEFGFFLREDNYAPAIWIVRIHRFATINTPNYRHHDRKRVFVSSEKLFWALPHTNPKPLKSERVNLSRSEVDFTPEEMIIKFRAFADARIEDTRYRHKRLVGELEKLNNELEDVIEERQIYQQARIMESTMFLEASEAVKPSQDEGATKTEFKTINDVDTAWKRFAEELGDNGNHE